MKTKAFYEAPSSELLLINFEEAFLQGTGSDNPGNGYGDNNLDPLDDDED